MNINDFEKSMSNLDETLLDHILEERFRRTERTDEKQEEKKKGIRRLFQNRTAVRWTFGIAAAVCLFAAGLFMPRIGIVPQGTDTSGYTGPETSHGSDREFRSNTLALFPSVFPEGLMVEAADIFGVLTPDYVNWEERMQIIVASQDHEERMWIEAASVSAMLLDGGSNILNVKDLTQEEAEKCFTVLPDGQHSFSCILQFNDQAVSYEYTGKKLTAEDIYNCIVSAKYFS